MESYLLCDKRLGCLSWMETVHGLDKLVDLEMNKFNHHHRHLNHYQQHHRQAGVSGDENVEFSSILL